MMNRKESKLALRILRFLKGHLSVEVTAFHEADAERVLLSATDGSKLLVTLQIFDQLHKAGLIVFSTAKAALSDEGRKKLQRLEANQEPYLNQHRNITPHTFEGANGKETVSVNLNESPLTRLAVRKTKNGMPWLNAEHVEAGERLRRDFTLGQLMQKVTSSWDFTSIGSTSRGAGGKADLSDNAIDARSRLSNALQSVGPDLATVLTDVCCFLKGLESVEREQKWPPRSAKLMLRTGLDLLARHYGTKAGYKPQKA